MVTSTKIAAALEHSNRSSKTYDWPVIEHGWKENILAAVFAKQKQVYQSLYLQRI